MISYLSLIAFVELGRRLCVILVASTSIFEPQDVERTLLYPLTSASACWRLSLVSSNPCGHSNCGQS